jgi:hypothetical protein
MQTQRRYYKNPFSRNSGIFLPIEQNQNYEIDSLVGLDEIS